MGGDASVAEISAASILAKTTRDAWMRQAAQDYPGYGFERHKGYGTALHLQALARLGPCPLHRRSFAPVKSLELFPAHGSRPMTQFVHLRLHTEFSLVDGVVRVPALMKAVAEAGMPAVALTDQSNLFAMVKFYSEAQKQGVKPIIGADILLREPDERSEPSRLTLLAQDYEGYRNLTRLVSRSYLEGQHKGIPMIERDWLQPASTARLIALSGAREGDVGRALLGGREVRCPGRAARLARAVRRPLLRRGAAHRPLGRGGLHPRRARAAARRAGAGRRDQRRAVRRAVGLRGPRGARMHPRRPAAGRSRPAASLHRGAVPAHAAGDGGAVRRPARSAGELGRDRTALLDRGHARQVVPARVSGARGDDDRRLPAQRSCAWPRAEADGSRGDRPAGARHPARGVRAAPRARAGRHLPDGFRGLLPDRRGLHPLGAGERRTGRTGTRLRRGLTRRLGAADHRPRPASARPAVRALPQSRARLHAGLRRGLLHGPARPGDRLRRADLRPRQGLADHHLRHHGRQGRGARRRAGARQPLRLRRRHRQAGALRAGHHAGRCPGQGAGTQAPLRGGGRGPRPHRPGPIAGRPDPQCGHARRRRGDRALRADRLRPAVLRAGQPVGRHAVRQGRRREDRPGEVRLSRPAHADHHRLGRRQHQPSAGGAGRGPARHDGAAARRCPDLRPAEVLPDHRGVPARVARHEGPHPPPAARPVRGRRGAGGAVPPGTAAVGHGGRLHRAQARPQRRRRSTTCTRASSRSSSPPTA